jgi:hypothetical protein
VTNKGPNERVGECDGCGYAPVPTMRSARTLLPDQDKWLCLICRHTIVGRLEDGYSASHSIREHEPVLRLVAYVGNVILAQLEQLRPR